MTVEFNTDPPGTNPSNRPEPGAGNMRVLRLGTRGSLLARTQSRLVAAALEQRHPGLRVELSIFKTSGDHIADRPLHEFGGKGLFTKELEQALLDGRVDFVVHSYKDLPVTMPLVPAAEWQLLVAATPRREDPRDVLVAAGSDAVARRVQDLPRGARVGTGSLRRRCQLLALRPDLTVQGIRGNIDTRLRKLRDGEFDAIVLAAAGVRRAALFDAAVMHPLDELLSAPGQGALALQCRRDDAETRRLLSALHDPATAFCVEAERQVVLGLNGDCHSPIAALATLERQGDSQALRLRARVGGRDGVPPVIEAAGAATVATFAETLSDSPDDAAADAESARAMRATVNQVLNQLRSHGAADLLAG